MKATVYEKKPAPSFKLNLDFETEKVTENPPKNKMF